MRKVISILFLAAMLTLSSCESWLDVEPKSEIKWDTMFETEQGFKDALLGCYVGLSEKSLYGGDLTCLFLDALAQQYYTKGASSSYRYVFDYSYNSTAVTNYSDNIWSKIYTTLANVNALIEAVEDKGEGVLNSTTHSLVKAEVYSLRAYLYLDLVRLFTWGDLAGRPDAEVKLAGRAIPYVKEYNKNIAPQETLANVLKFMHEDLNTAIDLFLDYAPESKKGSRPDDYVKLSDESKFFDVTNTKYRMNLKAAMATRMRLNMWEGNFDEAYDDAYVLRNTYTLTWVAKTNLETDENKRDLTFSAEMIFGLEAFKRFDDIIDPYFRRYAASGSLNENSQFLCLPSGRVTEIYGEELKDADWRYIYWWGEKAEENYAFYKFREVDGMTYTNKVSLIKSAEICYTEAECLLRAGGESNKVLAIEALNRVRNNRGLSAMPLENTLTEEQVWEELTKEWRKEFVGDGQLFYYYKRIGSTSIPYASMACDDNVYVLPLPKAEIENGNCENLIDRN